MSFFRRSLFCPSCLVEIDRDHVEVRDLNGERTGETRSLDEQQRGQDFLDLKEGLRLTCRVGHVLPDAYGTVPCQTVALVGPSLSMKTHFLAVTSYEALEGTAYARPDPHTTLSFSAPPSTEDLLRDQYFKLLEDHRALGRTRVLEDDESPVRHPICLEVRGARAAASVRGNTWQKHLLLFDAPGEQVAGSARDQARVSPYLREAAAVAFFVDLLQIAKVREELDMTIPADYTGNYSSTPISKASKLIRDNDRSIAAGAADVDALVVISKADVLQYAKGALREHVGLSGSELAVLTDTENARLAERLLDIYAPAVVSKVTSGFRSWTFHLASAIGSQPAHDGSVDVVQPFGCDAIFRELLRATRMNAP